MRSAFYNLINFINTAKVDDVYANAAKKILENINKIPELNITDVAEMCFVSTATDYVENLIMKASVILKWM